MLNLPRHNFLTYPNTWENCSPDKKAFPSTALCWINTLNLFPISSRKRRSCLICRESASPIPLSSHSRNRRVNPSPCRKCA